MTLSRGARYVLASLMGVGLAFIYIPLTVVVINSFNSSRTFSWPPSDFTTKWWAKALENTGVREALRESSVGGKFQNAHLPELKGAEFAGEIVERILHAGEHAVHVPSVGRVVVNRQLHAAPLVFLHRVPCALHREEMLNGRFGPVMDGATSVSGRVRN